jgi:NADH:ubiquinone oxidoreductase subunit 4 (subunit M)
MWGIAFKQTVYELRYILIFLFVFLLCVVLYSVYKHLNASKGFTFAKVLEWGKAQPIEYKIITLSGIGISVVCMSLFIIPLMIMDGQV